MASESPEVTPALSEISICKEHADLEPSYAVEKCAVHDDDGYVPKWKLRVNSLLPFTSACAIGSYWLYIAFRVRYTVEAQNLRHTVYPVAWLFISIELGVACEPSDILRIHIHGCMLMQIYYSTSSAYPIIAMFLD